jgi:hypothetical protein
VPGKTRETKVQGGSLCVGLGGVVGIRGRGGRVGRR